MRKGSLLKAAVETAKVAIGRDEKGTALYYAMYRMVKSNGKIRSNMYFDIFTEEILVGFLEGCSLANQALSKSEFLECVRLIDKKFEKSSLK